MYAVLVAVSASLAALRAAPAQRASVRGAEAREVAAVRAVYREVVRAIAAHAFARRDTTVHCSADDLGQEITVWFDRDSLIRQLTWVAGTEDHAETHRLYYDRAGRLRFRLVTLGAVNGTLREERDYYGEDRRVLRHRTKQLHGPGYPATVGWPVWQPRAWLHQLCSHSN